MHSHSAANSNNLCKVLNSLQQDCVHGEPVRLIVFGGSVTAGHSACGCCSRFIPSNTCLYSKVLSHRNPGDTEYAAMNNCSYGMKYRVQIDVEFCNWSAFLERWLQTMSPNCDIRYYNVAVSGMSSKIMAEKVVSLLRQTADGIVQLNAMDIVLIDYSYNDAETEVDGNGMEDFLRALLSMSVAGSEPAMIILETRKFVPYKTLRLYREVAEHYSIPLWSYREFLIHNMVENRTKYEQLLKDYTLRGLAIFDLHQLGWYHPGWPLHLLWSDLIAGGLISTAKNCSDRYSSLNAESGEDGVVGHSLPSRLKQVRTLSCNLMPSLMDESADVYIHVSSDKDKEIQSRTWFSTTWKVLAEGPHRSIGWISTLPEREQENTPLSSEMHSHHGSYYQAIIFQPQLLANTSSAVGNRDTLYTSSSGNSSSTSGISNSSIPILVGVDYLKTYLNAGVVDILWCDVRIGSIDSLWSDSSRKHSVHEYAKFRSTSSRPKR